VYLFEWVYTSIPASDQNMSTNPITSILSEDYAHFEEHCMSHPTEAEPVFDCVMELRAALTAFRLATEASRNESALLRTVSEPVADRLAPVEETIADAGLPVIFADELSAPPVELSTDDIPSPGPQEATLA
jgi:hypothetical protein